MERFDIDEFQQRYELWKKRQDSPYIILHVDLSVAHTDLKLNVSGDLLKVEQATDNDAIASVKFNFQSACSVNLMRYRKVRTCFEKIYFTNDAQADKTMDILIGVRQFFEIDDFFFRVSGGNGGENGGNNQGLPRTGQTVSYLAGDDGAYEKGWTTERPQVEIGGRWTVNGDGTVTDLATGLMWWDTQVFSLQWAACIAAIEAAAFAGHTDWRMCNWNELSTLAVVQSEGVAGHSYPAWVQAPIRTYLWTSTSRPSNPLVATRAQFNFGVVSLSWRSKINYSYYSMAVRLGDP